MGNYVIKQLNSGNNLKEKLSPTGSQTSGKVNATTPNTTKNNRTNFMAGKFPKFIGNQSNIIG